MLAVQPGGLGRAEEELGAVGVGARVGHGQDAGARVPDSERASEGLGLD